jgi:hypothetical protein
VRMLLKSWAMPPASCPSASVFCACASRCSSVRCALGREQLVVAAPCDGQLQGDHQHERGDAEHHTNPLRVAGLPQTSVVESTSTATVCTDPIAHTAASSSRVQSCRVPRQSEERLTERVGAHAGRGCSGMRVSLARDTAMW